MKILILANNQNNVELIKKDIPNIEKYFRIEIGDLKNHEVHEISDLIDIEFYQLMFPWPRPKFDYKTDDPENKIDITAYECILVYKRFLDGERGPHTTLLYENPPYGIFLHPTY